MERLAQKTRCVRKHSDHSATDEAARKIYNNLAMIIACRGGCPVTGSSNWNRDSPATIWKESAGKTGHYKQSP